MRHTGCACLRLVLTPLTLQFLAGALVRLECSFQVLASSVGRGGEGGGAALGLLCWGIGNLRMSLGGSHIPAVGSGESVVWPD